MIRLVLPTTRILNILRESVRGRVTECMENLLLDLQFFFLKIVRKSILGKKADREPLREFKCIGGNCQFKRKNKGFLSLRNYLLFCLCVYLTTEYYPQE